MHLLCYYTLVSPRQLINFRTCADLLGVTAEVQPHTMYVRVRDDSFLLAPVGMAAFLTLSEVAAPACLTWGKWK